ncbi:MAG TPA: hypothetical protein VLI54_02170 [Bacillota bacterium]|nr:hypothetical protein [Bacillota bacterium]
MTSSESIQPSPEGYPFYEGPESPPEVREQVGALLAHATEVVLTAPDGVDPTDIGNPQSPDFHVVARQARYNGSTIIFNPGGLEGLAGDTVDFGGVSMYDDHALPMQGAVNRHDTLVGQMLGATDGSGRVETTVERLAQVGGRPCRVVVELGQRPYGGRLHTTWAAFSAYRDLPDGRQFKQHAIVSYPSPYNRAIQDRDAIVTADGFFDEERDLARAIASSTLPEDEALPPDRPLGFDECDWLLTVTPS